MTPSRKMGISAISTFATGKFYIYHLGMYLFLWIWKLWTKCMISFSGGFCWTLRENLPTVISFWFGKQSGLPEWYLLAIFICLWLWPLWKITEISFLTETWTLQTLSSFLMRWQRSMMEELFCQLLETWYINSKPWFLINSSCQSSWKFEGNNDFTILFYEINLYVF